MFTDMTRDNGLAQIYGGYSQGVYSLPDDFVKAYEALAAELAKVATRETTDAKIATLTAKAAQLTGYGLADNIIVNHLQPALAKHVATFTADVQLIGHYAEQSEPTTDLLAQPEPVREAFLRHITAHSWYNPIRGAWKVLRARMTPSLDPKDTDGLLGEISNAPDILANWRDIGNMTTRGFVAPPWQGTAAHLRLGWIVRAGGQLWLPTGQQQSDAWTRYAQPVADNPAASHHVQRPQLAPSK